MPVGNQKKRVSKSQLIKIAEGGKRADKIRDDREVNHLLHEVPQAERELAQNLKEMPAEQPQESAIDTPQNKKKPSIFAKIFFFLPKRK